VTGLDDFKAVLKEYSNLAIWVAGGSVALPFIASFLSIIPPWPKGLDVITAIFQLLTLILVFQTLSGSSRRKVSRNVIILFVACFVTILAYIVVFISFTIYVPAAKRYIVVGYSCTSDAARVYTDTCPDLGYSALAGVAFDEFRLWTKGSITLVRTGLIGIWFVFFVSLSALVGSFLVFQMSKKGRLSA